MYTVWYYSVNNMNPPQSPQPLVDQTRRLPLLSKRVFLRVYTDHRHRINVYILVSIKPPPFKSRVPFDAEKKILP